jgi:hypothetical protein
MALTLLFNESRCAEMNISRASLEPANVARRSSSSSSSSIAATAASAAAAVLPHHNEVVRHCLIALRALDKRPQSRTLWLGSLGVSRLRMFFFPEAGRKVRQMH